jgi:RNA polymerase sigma factor (sigma-70 family)
VTEPRPGPHGLMTGLMNDRAWLDAFRDGNARAMERVFRAYAPLVLHMVRRGAGGVSGVFGQDEQDLVQEVFARVLRAEARRKYTGLVPFSAYLRGYVRLVLLEKHRPVRAEVADVFAETAQPLDGWEPGTPLPDETLLNREQVDAVRAFKNGLSASQRALMETRFEQGVSQRDAAELLGTTRQILRREEGKLVNEFMAFMRRKGF